MVDIMVFKYNWHKGNLLFVKWITVFLLFGLSLLLEYRERRIIHIITGFMWWGMVFFLVFILLPKLPKMQKSTQYEIVGFLIPRIFRTVSIVGFFAVFLGWFNALNDIASPRWSLGYFLPPNRIENTLFLIGIFLVTGLYLFHLFLENREITFAFRILESTENDVTSKVENLISKIRIIPVLGFTILTTGVLMMFVH
jgi:hypothetical protein